MAITSQFRPANTVGEVAVQHWQSARLTKPSVLKPLLATIDKASRHPLHGQTPRRRPDRAAQGAARDHRVAAMGSALDLRKDANEARYPMYLTIKELAAILRVDHKTIRNAIRDRRIEAVRVGRAFRIPTSAIDALAQAACRWNEDQLTSYAMSHRLPSSPLLGLPIAEDCGFRSSVVFRAQRDDHRRSIREIQLQAIARNNVGVNNAVRDPIAQLITVAWRLDVETDIANDHGRARNRRNGRAVKMQLYVVLDKRDRTELLAFNRQQLHTIASLLHYRFHRIASRSKRNVPPWIAGRDRATGSWIHCLPSGVLVNRIPRWIAR